MSAVFPPGAVELDAIVENPKILVFSKPRAGKTCLGASDDDVLVLNCEAQGTVSANRFDKKGNNVKYVDCTKWEYFDRHVTWLEDYADSHDRRIDLKWVVVDTLTTLQDQVLMRWILDQAHAKNDKRDLFVPSEADYGRNQIMLVDVVKRLNNLPVNVLYLAHVMTKMDQEGNEFLYPQIQGGSKSGGYKVAQQILSMTTSYGYLYMKPRIKNGKRLVDGTGRKLHDRIIQWEDEGNMQGGDRLNVLGPQTRNVTLKQIRQRIESTNKKEKEKVNATD